MKVMINMLLILLNLKIGIQMNLNRKFIDTNDYKRYVNEFNEIMNS